MKRKKDIDLAALGILSFFGLVGAAITLVILYVYPVMDLTCHYEETTSVDCQCKEKMLGLIETETLFLSDVRDAYIAKERFELVRYTGEIIPNTVYKLMVITASDTVEIDGFDEFGGIIVRQSAKKINDYLLTPQDESIRIWQATWVPLLISVFFLLVSLIILYSVVDSLFRYLIRREKG